MYFITDRDIVSVSSYVLISYSYPNKISDVG